MQLNEKAIINFLYGLMCVDKKYNINIKDRSEDNIRFDSRQEGVYYIFSIATNDAEDISLTITEQLLTPTSSERKTDTFIRHNLNDVFNDIKLKLNSRTGYFN